MQIVGASLPVRLSSGPRACREGSRFRGENRLQAGSYTDHLTAFFSTSEGEVHWIDTAQDSSFSTALRSSSPQPRFSANWSRSRAASSIGMGEFFVVVEAKRMSLCMCLTENWGEKSPVRSLDSFSLANEELPALPASASKKMSSLMPARRTKVSASHKPSSLSLIH